jgi:hypothetical protein
LIELQEPLDGFDEDEERVGEGDIFDLWEPQWNVL